MNDEKKPALYLYLDEAGNYDFRETGSKYFILTCVVMERPFNPVHGKILDIKYDCLELGFDVSRFHASDDKQPTRDSFFKVLTSHANKYAVYAVSINKSFLSDDMREPARLYSSAFRLLSECIIKIDDIKEYGSIIVITDALSTNTKKRYQKAELKSYLKTLAANGELEYSLYHHASASDINLQITDYFCWAIQRFLERDDDRSIVLIKQSLKGIWRVGDTKEGLFENVPE
jgi:hypothetical protein